MDSSAISRANDDLAGIRERCRISVKFGPSSVSARSSLGNSFLNGSTSSGLGSPAAQYGAFSGWAYSAISAIAKRIASQPAFVGKPPKSKPARRRAKSMLDLIEPLDSHPLIDLLNDPNDSTVHWSLMYSTVASLEITGKAFWWLSDSERDDRPFDLYYLPATWVRPSAGGWTLRVAGSATEYEIPSDRMAHFSLPDPSDPHKALSPLQSQADAVDTDTKLQRAQSASLSNGIFPGLAIVAGNPNGGPRAQLNNTQRQQLIESILARYRGFEKNGEPLVLDSLIQDVKPITTAPAEMGFTESEASTKSRILQAFGVNPYLLGQVEGANRASATVAEESFCNNVVNPLAELMSQVVTAWLLPAFGEPGLKFWIEPARAHDPEQTLQEWKVAIAGAAVTQNEIRTMLLGIPPVKGGDSYLVSATMVREPVGGFPPEIDSTPDEGARTRDRVAPGDRVRVKPGMDHEGMGKGEIGTVVSVSPTPALEVKFPSMPKPHKWYVEGEVTTKVTD